jgi:hemerythrin-like domain-containing protein
MACEPTGILRDEHRLILKVVDVLETFVDRGRDGAPADRLRDCVDFFRLYTDALHHGKEEDLLFDALTDRGFPRHAGPIAMMLQEHELGRSYVRRMAESLGALEDDDAAWRAFEHAARSYVQLLRQHIMKEDHALFEMADNAIDEPACRALCDAYDTVCARKFEGRTMQELERLAADLIETAAG